jgi:hypothetical protein
MGNGYPLSLRITLQTTCQADVRDKLLDIATKQVDKVNVSLTRSTW